ncbi:MAG TPA: pyridoxamine 5'-phosphate oxidase family protein [Acidimicrobiales bacterium]|nr:pyridoxamine 5'-phosphate oxidase family protein [Acidimicrobiales bacterium]
MLTWKEFTAASPELAAIGREHLYQWGIGLAFLATVRADGGPRVHPVCPVIGDDAIHVLIQSGPKQRDLLRDGRYGLHSETFAPPREDDGFYLSGRVRPVHDAGVRQQVAQQLRTERQTEELWPTFDQDLLFELLVDRALLTLTQPGAGFPKGPTVWVAP